MKNLILANHKIFRLPLPSPATDEESGEALFGRFNPSATTLALDVSRQIVYYVDSGLVLHAYNLVTQKQVLSISLIASSDEDEEEEELLLPGDRVVGLHYIRETESVVLIATSAELGQIISIGAVTSRSLDQTTLSSNTTQESTTLHALSGTDLGFLGSGDDHDADQISTEGSIEVIGQIEGGFSHAMWSPDHELLVLGCTNGNIIVMSNQFEVIGESPVTGQVIEQQKLGQSNPYVHLTGTTQQQEYQQLQRTNKLINTHNETDIRISWRGDGQYFVTSSLQHDVDNPLQYKRLLRVWSRQCVLTSQSESVHSTPFPTQAIEYSSLEPNRQIASTIHQGLGHIVAWRPSGNVIATLTSTEKAQGIIHVQPKSSTTTSTPSQQQPQQPQQQSHLRIEQNVQFYERNGLPRYNFPLCEDTLPGQCHGFIVCEMQWNSDSTVLAVSLYDITQKCIVIKCFMCKNYHWSCKFVYTLPSNDLTTDRPVDACVKFLWQPNRPFRLIVIAHDVTVHILDLVHDIIVSKVPLYAGAMVNGREVGVTYFAKAAIPPPLSARNYLFPTDITNITFCETTPTQTISNACIQSSKDMLHYKLTTAATNGVRSDIVSPMVVSTSNNMILFPTDAIMFDPSYHLPRILASHDISPYQLSIYIDRLTYIAANNTIKQTVFAPEYQPERQQAINRAVSTAKAPAFFAISLAQIHSMVSSQDITCNDIDLLSNTATIRHLQWIYATQWRQLHVAFSIENQTAALAANCTSFNAYIKTTKSSQADEHQINMLSYIESSPDAISDVLVLVQFAIDFTYDATADRWTPVTIVDCVRRVPLCITEEMRLEATAILDAATTKTAASTATTQSTTPQLPDQHIIVDPAVELCNDTIARVFMTSHSAPSPRTPEDNLRLLPPDIQTTQINQAYDKGLQESQRQIIHSSSDISSDDMLWHQQHTAFVQSPPALHFVTTSGHVLELLIPPSLTRISLTTPTTKPHFVNPVALTDSSPIPYDPTSTTLQLNHYGRQLPSDCLFFSVSSMFGEKIWIGLDQLRRLLINNIVVAPQCISFQLSSFLDCTVPSLPSATPHAINNVSRTGHGYMSTYIDQSTMISDVVGNVPVGLFPRFLLITIASEQHALFTVDLRLPLEDNINPLSPLRQDSHMVRLVESGAIIIQSIPDLIRPRLIVQQPRGNLEVITPRSLGLTAIFCNLFTKQYTLAFRSLRTNKIDLNLFIDHNYDDFIANIVEILRTLYLPDNITLLLSSITNEVCTGEQYPRYHRMFLPQNAMHRLLQVNQILSNGIRQQSLTIQAGPGVIVPHTNAGGVETSIIEQVQQTVASHSNDQAASLDSLFQLFLAEGSEKPTDDKELLMKQFSLPTPEDQPAAKTNNHQQQQKKQKQLKSTAQSFSNRTRAHQQLGNDHNDLNNQYVSVLGEEAGMNVTNDGSGQAYMKQLSRVEHWGVGELDIRHVYSSAKKLFAHYDAIQHEKQPLNNDTVHLVKKSASSSAPQQTALQQVVAHMPSLTAATGINVSPNTAAASTTTQPTAVVATSTKCNAVCDAIIHTFQTVILHPNQITSLEEQHQIFLIPIITAHLRKDPPDFLGAMHALQTSTIYERQKQQSALQKSTTFVSHSAISFSTQPLRTAIGPRPTPPSSEEERKINALGGPLQPTSSERGLKYMLILADKEDLWKAAISTYDANLAESVATHSGRDPKQFVPFLTTFHAMLHHGPVFSATQVTSVHVAQTFERLKQFLIASNQQLWTELEPYFTSEQQLITSMNAKTLNDVVIPSALGVFFQRAYIDVHLQSHHDVVIQYANAIAYISQLFHCQSPQDVLTTANINNFATLAQVLLKLTFYVQSIYKLISGYLTAHPYLSHLIVHMFATPLPPRIEPSALHGVPGTESFAPLGGPGSSSSTLPPIPEHLTNIFTSSQYAMLQQYALWLVQNCKQYHLAGDIYMYLGFIHDAVACYINNGYTTWKFAISTLQRYSVFILPANTISATTLSLVESTQNSNLIDQRRVAYHNLLVRVLCDVLTQQQHALPAAELQFYNLAAPNIAIATLLAHKYWETAFLYATNLLQQRNANQDYQHATAFFESTFLKPFVQQVITKEIAWLEENISVYKSAVERLRTVRLVKQLVFGAQAKNELCVFIYNKGAIDLGNVTGLIPAPRLVLRIPGDDVLELIITGSWRGQPTGLQFDGQGFNGSLSNLSTATGLTLASLAPSVAASIQSLSSAFSGQSMMSGMSTGRLSNGSLMSAASGSVLSLGAAERGITAEERRLKRHTDKIKSKQTRKKVRVGDPREEETLSIQIAYLTPREQRLEQWSALIRTLESCGEFDVAKRFSCALEAYQRVIMEEEATPMYIMSSFTPWQQQSITEYFNWPAAMYTQSEQQIATQWREKEEERQQDEEKKAYSCMSKSQRVQFDQQRAEAIQMTNKKLTVAGQRADSSSSIQNGLFIVDNINPKDDNQSKAHTKPLTNEEKAVQNAQQMAWLQQNAVLASSMQSTFSLLGSSTQDNTSSLSDVVTQALLAQIHQDLRSTRRTTQLNLNKNPFGQKSTSEKVAAFQAGEH